MYWHLTPLGLFRRVFVVGGDYCVSRHAVAGTGKFKQAGGDGPLVEILTKDAEIVFKSRWPMAARAALAYLQAADPDGVYKFGWRRGRGKNCCTTGGINAGYLWTDLARDPAKKGAMLDSLEDRFLELCGYPA